MIIGFFTTTPTDLFFGEDDTEMCINDIKRLGFPIVTKEKRLHYPSVQEVIRMADIVIGCPFTSPVIEALSMGVPAFWYDPNGRCTLSPYYCTPMYRAGLGGLVNGVAFWTSKSSEQIKEITREYGYMTDPFCDGAAKTRVRELLYNSREAHP